MYKCLFCGLVNSNSAAKFCTECGPNSPAIDWTTENVDQESKVTQYVSMLSEFYFEAQNQLEVEKRSLKMRERLKISHDTHSEILSKFDEQKKAIAHLSNFRFEFNENVIDAYAGHDTFLNFRYTNLSEEDMFKVSLFWSDPTSIDNHLHAETDGFVNPQSVVAIGCSTIFERIGIKEISKSKITITDQYGEKAQFLVEPFKFKVSNHDQKVSNHITTNQNISIEGRGVIDASGVSADNSNNSLPSGAASIWKELNFSYIPVELEKLKEEIKAKIISNKSFKQVKEENKGSKNNFPKIVDIYKDKKQVATGINASQTTNIFEKKIENKYEKPNADVYKNTKKIAFLIFISSAFLLVFLYIYHPYYLPSFLDYSKNYRAESCIKINEHLLEIAAAPDEDPTVIRLKEAFKDNFCNDFLNH